MVVRLADLDLHLITPRLELHSPQIAFQFE